MNKINAYVMDYEFQSDIDYVLVYCEGEIMMGLGQYGGAPEISSSPVWTGARMPTEEEKKDHHKILCEAEKLADQRRQAWRAEGVAQAFRDIQP